MSSHCTAELDDILRYAVWRGHLSAARFLVDEVGIALPKDVWQSALVAGNPAALDFLRSRDLLSEGTLQVCLDEAVRMGALPLVRFLLVELHVNPNASPVDLLRHLPTLWQAEPREGSSRPDLSGLLALLLADGRLDLQKHGAARGWSLFRAVLDWMRQGYSEWAHGHGVRLLALLLVHLREGADGAAGERLEWTDVLAAASIVWTTAPLALLLRHWLRTQRGRPSGLCPLTARRLLVCLIVRGLQAHLRTAHRELRDTEADPLHDSAAWFLRRALVECSSDCAAYLISVPGLLSTPTVEAIFEAAAPADGVWAMVSECQFRVQHALLLRALSETPHPREPYHRLCRDPSVWLRFYTLEGGSLLDWHRAFPRGIPAELGTGHEWVHSVLREIGRRIAATRTALHPLLFEAGHLPPGIADLVMVYM